MASVLTPLKSVSKQDWYLYNDSKIKLSATKNTGKYSWIDWCTGETKV